MTKRFVLIIQNRCSRYIVVSLISIPPFDARNAF